MKIKKEKGTQKEKSKKTGKQREKNEAHKLL